MPDGFCTCCGSTSTNSQYCDARIMLLIVVPDNDTDAGKLVERETPTGNSVFFACVRESQQDADGVLLRDAFNSLAINRVHQFGHNAERPRI